MIPGKLSQIKAIAELESIEGGATDLTGDSGKQCMLAPPETLHAPSGRATGC